MFRTKLELGVELVWWAVSWLKHLGKPVWVVTDVAYAMAQFLKPMRALAVTVVSRLRKDAALWTVPGPKPKHRPGPQPTYGDRRIDLAKRGGQRRGWATGRFTLYGKGFYARLTDADREGGPKPKMQAVGGRMRKLAMLCYGVLENRTPFDPQWADRPPTGGSLGVPPVGGRSAEFVP